MGDMGGGAWDVMSPPCEAALVSPCLATAVGWGSWSHGHRKLVVTPQGVAEDIQPRSLSHSPGAADQPAPSFRT